MNRLYLNYLAKTKNSKKHEKLKKKKRLFYNKKKSKKYKRINGRIIPVKKICIKCGIRRVRYHHILCDKCWEETNGRKC